MYAEYFNGVVVACYLQFVSWFVDKTDFLSKIIWLEVFCKFFYVDIKNRWNLVVFL